MPTIPSDGETSTVGVAKRAAASQGQQCDPDTDDTMSSDPNVVLPTRRWIVEPVCLLFCIGILSLSPVLSQYVYYKVGQQFNATGNSTRAFVCDRNSLANSSEHSLTDMIQNEASSWTLYRSTVSSVVALVVLPIYTSSSDYLGRKPALLLPAVGMALDSLGLLLVVLLDLPLLGTVVSGAVGALGGGYGTMFAAIFAYLADTTTRKWRPLRVAIVESMFGIAGVVMESLMGWWIKLMGYTVPLIFSTAVVFANVLFVIFFVPEVRKRASKPTSNTKTGASNCLQLALLPVTNIASLFKNSARVTATLALLLLSLGFFCLSFMGASTVSTLYQMNYPFCLDSVFIGYLSSVKIVGYQIGATIGLVVLRKYLHVKTVGLIVLGLLSSALGSLVMGLAQTVAMLFVSAAVSMFAMLAIPMFRALTSQIAPAERQGALFSCIGVLEMAGNLVGTAGFTLLYKSTLSWMPGFMYLVAAATTAAALLLTAMCYVVDACYPPAVSLSIDAAEEVEDGPDSSKSFSDYPSIADDDDDTRGIVNH